jgi:hypothetical protein
LIVGVEMGLGVFHDFCLYLRRSFHFFLLKTAPQVLLSFFYCRPA